MESNAPQATERVLSTQNTDGSRRWMRPKVFKGKYYRRRFAVAWMLISVFTLIPHFKINGKPMVLLDIAKSQFTFFGTTFLPTDTFLLMLLLFSIFVGIFLLTATLGRVWCGWGCPQTVYMEFLYRPLEALIEGGRAQQLKLDRDGSDGRRVLKLIVFFFVSALLANTFLAYFVSVESLRLWMTSPPTEHPAAFMLMLGVTLLMFFDFAYFREQTCIVACPYGRFQSVLLDRHSLIVGYDSQRGEPRGKGRRQEGPGKDDNHLGDCIDCKLCLATCPTGIDIREGLQMECIHCTQCIDACDTVMAKVKKPLGLIRYTSQEELVAGESKFIRPRLIVYAGILGIMFSVFVFSLFGKSDADITILRGLGSPFSILRSGPQAGEVSNQIRLKIANRADHERSFTFLIDDQNLTLVAPENPLVVGSEESALTAAFITLARDLFVGGEYEITIHIEDGEGFTHNITYRLLGPNG